MNKRTIFASAVALLTTAGIAVAAGNNASAQNKNMPHPHPHAKMHSAHGHQMKRDGLPRGFEQLGLSDVQKAQIKTIMEQNRPQKVDNQDTRRADFQQKMAQRRVQEQQLMSNKTFNEQAARNMIAERQQERAAMEKNHAERELQMLKQRHAVFQVLTPAQQQKFVENQKQQQERMEQRFKQRMPQQQK
ncbi:Spy/CpxP family protein refolding chaperone [Wielerella bovis]|uniref:Spy/CpxP family protein refolding chaperone n=1 Tax=Wielerella bovis TaxID=2917790 RepID=UPI0020186BA1|nr:Spy/CpxP family protein refolding chaperone [Wielerella bovis]MCG7658088.1 Spy/CpxP family protein refolding chaperone [Wielerella bovis]MCG7660310.1 Spy/CpxP family protein refolding chaperone [Wielerella bovis]